MAKHIIWSNENLDVNDWREAYQAFVAENKHYPHDPNSEDELYRFMMESNDMYLTDERFNLNIETDGRILIIADIGLWFGRRSGYQILDGNVKNILNTDGDYATWYGDGHNIKATVRHHDGSNYYEYRVIREDRNIDNLLDDIYNGREVSRKKLNYYTKSLWPYVAKVYGW